MVRAFTAVDIPEEISEKLKELEKEINVGRPVAPDKMHTTLEFFSSLDSPAQEEVEKGLENIELKPFEIEVQSLGVFPSKKYIRVLWAGINSEKIFKLYEQASHHEIESDNDYDFHPHITVLRIDNIRKGDKKKLHQALEDYKGTSFGTFTVKNVKLYRSDLRPHGSEYTLLQKKKL